MRHFQAANGFFGLGALSLSPTLASDPFCQMSHFMLVCLFVCLFPTICGTFPPSGSPKRLDWWLSWIWTRVGHQRGISPNHYPPQQFLGLGPLTLFASVFWHIPASLFWRFFYRVFLRGPVEQPLQAEGACQVRQDEAEACVFELLWSLRLLFHSLQGRWSSHACLCHEV